MIQVLTMLAQVVAMNFGTNYCGNQGEYLVKAYVNMQVIEVLCKTNDEKVTKYEWKL